MRVLFVSGTSFGGAARSTTELAAVLHARGHYVATLMLVDEATRTIERHKRLTNLRVKTEQRGAPPAVRRAVERAERLAGRRRHCDVGHPFDAWRAAAIENALAAAVRDVRPDVVVANSLERTAWRQMRADLAAAGIPSVLYLREASAIRHLVDPPAPPDLLLANAEAHAIAASEAGFECAVVPSVVDTSRCLVESTRARVLLVNPIALYGVDIALDLARARPDIPFAFAESWPIPPDERAALAAALATVPNVELRAHERDPRRVYADARLLLMLCRVPSRPRVIAEAQANGIPVLATDLPGHGEAVGDGGLLIAPDAPLTDWLAALDRLWVDEGGELSRRARDHAVRADMAPDAVATRFEALVGALLPAASAPGALPDGTAPTGSASAPAISVVIPAHNAGATLGAQLEAVLSQELDDPFEVVVVDNRSSDDTADVVRRAAATDPRVRLVTAVEGAGPSYARNAAVRAARAPLIACCDADDVVADGWLGAMRDALHAHDAVAGVLEVDRLNDPQVVAGRGTTLVGHAGGFAGVTFPHGCNMGFRRTAFLAAGGLDERLHAGEEIDLAIRLLARGVTVHEEPAAVVHYRFRTDSRDQWNQAFEGGRVKPHLCRALAHTGGTPPGRLAGLRNWAWMARTLPRLVDPAVRVRFRWILASRCGQLAGCVRHRTLYL